MRTEDIIGGEEGSQAGHLLRIIHRHGSLDPAHIDLLAELILRDELISEKVLDMAKAMLEEATALNETVDSLLRAASQRERLLSICEEQSKRIDTLELRVAELLAAQHGIRRSTGPLDQ